MRCTHGAFHHIACLESVLPDNLLVHIDVVRAAQVVVVAAAQESVAIAHHFQHTVADEFFTKVIGDLLIALSF